MREHLDTMPVWEAYRGGSECPLCEIRQKNEAAYCDNFLGGSVMEPSTRVEVNSKGFCQRHFKMLFDASNRLPLALMTHTHLKEIMGAMGDSESVQKPGLFKKAPANQPAARGMTEGCIICERLDNTMERYLHTLLYMYESEPQFKDAFLASKGLCLPHYYALIEEAPKRLSGRVFEDFMNNAARLERDNLKRVEGELEWFTLKFDYRNQNKPWGNSQDAVERAINKLRGKCIY